MAGKKPEPAPTIEEIHRTQLVEKVSAGLPPYSRETYINEARHYLERAAQDIVEAGRRLILLREMEGHGTFVKLLETELSISTSTAYNFMKAANTVSNFQSIGNLSPTKIYALMDMTHDDLKELDDTGSVAGMTIDDIDAMTTRELRNKVREYRRNQKKGEEQLRSVQDKLDFYEGQAKSHAGWVELMTEAQRQGIDALARIKNLATAAAADEGLQAFAVGVGMNMLHQASQRAYEIDQMYPDIARESMTPLDPSIIGDLPEGTDLPKEAALKAGTKKESS